MTLTLPIRLDPTSAPDKTLHVTASGLPVRIYSINGGGKYPIHGAVYTHDRWEPRSWLDGGKYEMSSEAHDLDLRDRAPVMVARIEALEAENRKLRVERYLRVEELEEHIANMLEMQECACGYDDPMDVCLGHATVLKRIKALEAERDRLRRALSHYEGVVWDYAGGFVNGGADARRWLRQDQGEMARAALKGDGE